MKILIAGDDFTPSTLFQECLKERLRKTVKELEFDMFDIAPAQALSEELTEVREYWGNTRDLIDRIKGVEVLLVTFAPVTAKVIEAAKDLRVIGCARGGPVNVNIEAATTKGIPVLNTPGRNAEAVAEYTFGLILTLTRNIHRAIVHVRNGKWISPREDTFEKPTGPELLGRTIGIVGFGQVGSRVGAIAKEFGMNILVYDPYIQKQKVEAIGKVVDLQTLLEKSDIVTLHTRLASESRALIGAREFALMKKDAYIINTSRPNALDEEALYHALADGRLGGAALDVFRSEPISADHPILKLDNVIFTPHAAGISTDIPLRTCRMISEDIERFLDGKSPEHIMNPITIKKF